MKLVKAVYNLRGISKAVEDFASFADVKVEERQFFYEVLFSGFDEDFSGVIDKEFANHALANSLVLK
jgi:hypothetical protein